MRGNSATGQSVRRRCARDVAVDILSDIKANPETATAQLLVDARRRHGLNQRSLARRARTSQAYISRVESGDVSPRVDTLDRLLHAMGERLDLRTAPGPLGNRSREELRADVEDLSAEQRILQAAELAYALTRLATAESKRP